MLGPRFFAVLSVVTISHNDTTQLIRLINIKHATAGLHAMPRSVFEQLNAAAVCVLVLQVRAFEHALRVLSPWFTPEVLARLTISSVDGYQGREADVVLFSAVRCVWACWHRA